MENFDDYLKKVGKFQQELNAGRADIDKFPMPIGKEYGRCTEDDLQESREIFKRIIRSTGKEITELRGMIKILGEEVAKEMDKVVDEISSELQGEATKEVLP